jgi:hypothetical protein
MMKKYKMTDDLRAVCRSIKKDFQNDRVICYLCNSAIRTKDELNRVVSVGMIHASILEKYNFEIWEK